MELLPPLLWLISIPIGYYFLHRAIRAGVRDALTDTDARREQERRLDEREAREPGGDDPGGRSIGS